MLNHSPQNTPPTLSRPNIDRRTASSLLAHYWNPIGIVSEKGSSIIRRARQWWADRGVSKVSRIRLILQQQQLCRGETLG